MGENQSLASKAHCMKLQDSSVKPLQEVCDQSVVSIQMEDSRVIHANRRQVTTEFDQGTDFKRPVETSKASGDENIQDSVFDGQLHLPGTFRGERKILDNQQSISIISYRNDDHVQVTDQQQHAHH